MYQQTSINVPTIKFHENLYGGIHCFIKTHGWTACLPELLGDMVLWFEHNGMPGLFTRYTRQFFK